MPAPVIAWINAVHLDARQRQLAPYKAPRILLARNTDANIAITVRLSNNARDDIAAATLILTCCRDKAMTTALFAVSSTPGAQTGDAIFVVPAGATAALAVGRAYYTVEIAWPDDTREQLVGPTELWILASGPADASPVPSPPARALPLRSFSVTFAGESSKSATFTDVGATAYVVAIAVSVDAVDGGTPLISASGLSSSGLTLNSTAPFTGTVWVTLYAQIP